VGELEGLTIGQHGSRKAMIKHMKTLQDGEGQFVYSAADGKEMEAASKARTVEVKALETEKKGIGAQLETYKKILGSRTKGLNKLKQRRNHGNSPIKNGLKKILAILGIDRAAYHGGNLNDKNIQKMFQESDSIFLQFQELLLQVDEEDGRCGNKEIIDVVHWYSKAMYRI
jgi:hypothetical protein